MGDPCSEKQAPTQPQVTAVASSRLKFNVKFFFFFLELRIKLSFPTAWNSKCREVYSSGIF